MSPKTQPEHFLSFIMIVFSGLDGAGKSTQIELLKRHYIENKYSVFVFWSRGGYTPGMEYLKKLLRKSKNHKIPAISGHTVERENSFSKPVVRKLWLSFAILDLIYFYSIYLRYKKLTGLKIICDRYFFDTIIDFKLNFPQENVEKWLLWKFMKFVSITPQKHFVLTIPVEESLRRSKLKNEPFPDTKETLEKRLKDYLMIADKNKYAIHIDGTKSIKEINKYILDNIS